MKKIKKYEVRYEISNGEHPFPILKTKIIEAEYLENAIYKVKKECSDDYMACDIKSIVEKEN